MKAKMRAPNKKVPRRPPPKQREDNPKSLLYNPQFEKLVGEDCLITLKCSICLEFYNDPTVLPCGHTFCSKCLLEMATHAKLNRRDPDSSEAYIGCPECREFVYISALTNRETTLNYPLQQIIDIMMKREEGNEGMIVSKPKMVSASTSYHKSDFEEEQRAMEKQERDKLMAEVNHEMDGFERQLATSGSLVHSAFLDIEKIRLDHLKRVKTEEEAAAKAKAERKYVGKTLSDSTDFPYYPQQLPLPLPLPLPFPVPRVGMPATSMYDPAIVSYSMFHHHQRQQQRPMPSFADYMRRPAVPVHL